MSHLGYPYQQGSNPVSPGGPKPIAPPPTNWETPYHQNSAPYPAQTGFVPPSIGFNVNPPVFMPQSYEGVRYPPLSYFIQPYPEPATYLYPLSYPSNQGRALPEPKNKVQAYSQSSSSLPRTRKQTSLYPTEARRHSSSDRGACSTTNTSAALKKSPTVVPISPFNPRKDAELLRDAMKGFCSKEKVIINILTKRSNAQRLKIAHQFKTFYGKDLSKELKSKLSGSFAKVVTALMTPLPEYYAKELYEAITGLGTDETVLTEVLCSLSNAEIRTIKAAYREMYCRNLESDLKSDTSFHFKRLMVSLCNAGRDESMVTNITTAAADAHALYNAGEKIWGTDESTFNKILCQRNYAQLRLVFQEYHRITGHDIEKAIKNEFSGDIQKGFLAVIRSIKNQQAFFAQRLHKSMTGLETNHDDLIRLVVTRCEVDMGDIKRVYALNYKESLAGGIKCDSSGSADYKKCVLALLGEE